MIAYSFAVLRKFWMRVISFSVSFMAFTLARSRSRNSLNDGSIRNSMEFCRSSISSGQLIGRISHARICTDRARAHDRVKSRQRDRVVRDAGGYARPGSPETTDKRHSRRGARGLGHREICGQLEQHESSGNDKEHGSRGPLISSGGNRRRRPGKGW